MCAPGETSSSLGHETFIEALGRAEYVDVDRAQARFENGRFISGMDAAGRSSSVMEDIGQVLEHCPIPDDVDHGFNPRGVSGLDGGDHVAPDVVEYLCGAQLADVDLSVVSVAPVAFPVNRVFRERGRRGQAR